MSDEWNEQLEYARIQRLPVWERPLLNDIGPSPEWQKIVESGKGWADRPSGRPAG